MRSRRHRITASAIALVLLALGLAVASPAEAAAAPGDPWMDTSLSPDERADLLAAAMTFEQKLSLFDPDLPSIPELGIPAKREIDGGTGVVLAPGAQTTSFPSASSLASTWDPDLARAFGRQGGREAWLTGWVGWAAPAVDLTRNPFHGRQWATFGKDPVLGGVLPAAVVEGINEQPGVYSLPKHWLVNTQETQRNTLNNIVDERTLREVYVRQWEPLLEAGPGAVMCAFPQLNGEFSCENEHLLLDILKGDLGFPGWVSSDFNACRSFEAFLAGADACGPGFPTRDQLRAAVLDGTIPEARFEDMVHRVLRTYFARGLIDNPPPGSLEFPRPDASPLPAEVVASGQELAYRIAVDGSVLLRNDDEALPLDDADIGSIAVIGEGADRYISGFGADVVRNPTRVIPILDGIRARAGDEVAVEHVEGFDPVRVGDLMPGAQPVPSSVLTPAGSGDVAGLTAEWYPNPVFAGPPLVTRVEDQVNWSNGLGAVLALFGAEPSPAPKVPQPFLGIPSPSIRWTGTLTPAESGTYELGFTLLGRATLSIDGAAVLSADADTIASESVEIDLVAGQSYDVGIDYVADAPNQCCPGTLNIGPAIRFSWTPPSGLASPEIQRAVDAARASDVAIVVANDYLGESLDRGHLGLVQNQDVLIEAVAEANPNTIVVLTTGGAVEMPWLDDVAAVVESWYPGQEQGRAVAALLFGDENFSGKLPISWFESEEQVTEDLGIENPFFDVNNPGVAVPHDEGVFVGYRGYDEFGPDPLFEFGYGGSYTTFDYDRLRVQDPRASRGTGTDNARPGRVRVGVENTGDVAGTEVVQVYQGELRTDVDTPERQLVGWARVTLAPGERRTVEITIDPDAATHPLSYWDVGQGAWVTPPGRSRIYVGASSRDIRERDDITIEAPRRR